MKKPTKPDPVALPFVKWAGGKRQLLPELRRHLPATFGRYFEPFVGGAALFFDLRPTSAVLGDMNARLVRTYRAVQGQVEDVIARLAVTRYDSDYFYTARATDIDAAATDAEVAAWFIYLNRAGFNGLYRVNSKGHFNVPFGRHGNPTLCPAALLRACSAALQGVEVRHADFAEVVERAEAGDLVYFDPPYVPVSNTAYFTSYTKDAFGPDAQRRLRDVAVKLKQRGVHVLLSNSDAPFVRELYGTGAFTLHEVQATRGINSNAAARGPVGELIIA